ncbi:putative ring-h2 finger protein atl21a [Quercus suber]|uniref:RING-type E3 ubiquitin transferase n=1 Tax=Quercus suber TaxID=58331 RepID=A0AAW0LAZ8_QUESU
MEISHRMVIPTLLLFVLFIVDLGECHNRSSELRCGYHGPAIRFPFRLKDRQPADQQRGYPGFDLYCSDNNHTVLELPTSVKTFVNSIDYKSQQINVTVSDGCFPRIIRGLHLPSSPFQFKTENTYLYNYALFNCTPLRSIVLFMLFNRIMTKMYSVSSVPSDIWNSPFLELTWSEPAKCGRCERKGKKCRFQNNSTDLKTECFDPYKDKGIVFCLISTFMITTSSSLSILGPFLLALAVYAFYHWHPIDRPSVKSVVQMFEGKGDKLTIPPNPFASTSSRRVSENMPTKRLIQELEVIPESD